MKQARVPVDDDEVEPQVCVIEVRDQADLNHTEKHTKASTFLVARSICRDIFSTRRWGPFYDNGLTLKVIVVITWEEVTL